MTEKEQLQPTDNSTKKRRIDHTDLECNKSPILFLNVGGANRNIRRSLLNDLRVASQSNPLCDIILQSDHWSFNQCQTITIKDNANDTVRLYLDRNPAAFDDLLQYIECGRDFLRDILRQDGLGSRLNLLERECDYFTVKTFPIDLDSAIYGDPVAIHIDDWVTIKGEGKKNKRGEYAGWCWDSLTGNEALVSMHKKPVHPPATADVHKDGLYLVFFSLHSVAVTALPPEHGYRDKSNDELCALGVFHNTMTESISEHWTYPLVRCGAFDYRADREERENHPLLVTASCSDVITLREGSMLHPQHGHGVVMPQNIMRIEQFVNRFSEYLEHSGAVNYMTFVRLTGSNIVKFNVSMDFDQVNEPKIIKWTPCNIDVQRENVSLIACLDEDKSTIRFARAERPRIHLDVCTKGGVPLQNFPEVVFYRSSAGDAPYNNKMTEYGHISDVIFAEEDSYITARASDGACFAQHESMPVVFDKIPTQGLTIMRLKPSTCVDRYRISKDESGRIVFHRSLPIKGNETQDPIFKTEGNSDLLIAQKKCQCISFCSVSSIVGSHATLQLNSIPVVHSQICQGSGRGSHSLNGILDLDEDDYLDITCKYRNFWAEEGVVGNLTLVQLTE